MTVRCEYSFQSCKSSTSAPCTSGQLVALSQSASASTSASVSRRCSTSQSSANTSSVEYLPKLSVIDKDNIRILYDRLDKNKMWHLSNGTIVEEKMREVALKFDYEQ